jgi:UDP-N-acetylmuramoyl-tripeptide--D-alanyl-D-alanine ligase
MNLHMTWGDLARAAGGRLVCGDPSAPVSALSTDTRRLRAGQAFWALKGERFDAHDLLDAALAEKAGGFVVAAGRLAPGSPRPKWVVEVPDTLKALQALAAHHRRRFDIPVVGITGSNGKTTTKEMLREICARVGPTCASPGNWNNQLGVPLSVLELTSEHVYAVFELADSHPGDIDEVAAIAQPSLALLTNIGPDHLEFYGTMEANFKTKCELIERLPEEGKAVINIDDPWLEGLEPRLGRRAVTYGMNPRALVRFEGKDCLIIDRHKVKVSLRAFGELSRYNAAGAAAAAWALGIDADAIRRGLEAYRPHDMRLEPMLHPSGCAVVFDAYNANPASMRASVAAFCEEYAGRRKILVLGDMKELGPGSADFHRELGLWLAGLPLHRVYFAGPDMKAAHEALLSRRPRFTTRYCRSTKDALESLKQDLSASSAVLFKASRAMRFEDILASLSISPCSTT